MFLCNYEYILKLSTIDLPEKYIPQIFKVILFYYIIIILYVY